jgi:hypothetical protein
MWGTWLTTVVLVATVLLVSNDARWHAPAAGGPPWARIRSSSYRFKLADRPLVDIVLSTLECIDTNNSVRRDGLSAPRDGLGFDKNRHFFFSAQINSARDIP